MKVIIQRVKSANLTSYDKQISKIQKGLLVLLGIKEDDTKEDALFLINKIANMRIFDDLEGKLNLSVKDINGEVLVVSNFTIYGEARKGNRPNFMKSAKKEVASKLYEYFVDELNKLIKTKKCAFGEEMKIHTILDGPTTIILQSEL